MAADAAVRVMFDKAVVRSTVAGRFSVDRPIGGCRLDTAFSAPSTAPCWIHWLPGNLGFELLHHGDVFAPAQRYVFTLSGGFADEAGDTNGLDHHWDLTAAPGPRVSAFSPGDGSAAVPPDSPLSVTFSTPMDAPSTAAAITLQPEVAGTRVVRNLDDRTRFVVLPGQLLDPGIAYTLSVSGAARAEDNQALAAPVSARFITGPRLATAHAAVLVGRPGEGSTELLLPSLVPGSPGEPTGAPLLLRAGRCLAASCGAVATQAPLETFASAAVAADAAHVALVVTELGGPVPATSLEIIDTATDTQVGHFAGADRASWSPSGRLLAFTSGGDVEVFNAVSRHLAVVAAATGLVATPVWAGDSTLVLSTANGNGSPGGVELVDLVLGARYSLPGVPAASVAVAASPGGTELAVVSAAGVVTVPIGGGGGAVQHLAGRLDVLGFTGEGTVIAVSHSADTAQLVRLNVAGGESTPLRIGGAGMPRLDSVRLAPDGRRLVFLSTDAQGVSQVDAANADGSGAAPLTRFTLVDGTEAQSVDFAS